MFDLRNRIEETCEIAREKLTSAQQKYKTHFDKKAKMRTPKVGDEVLVMRTPKVGDEVLVMRSPKVGDEVLEMRTPKVGDEVLVMLPTDHSKLLLHWKGPYTVIEKVGITDYRIEIGDRKRLFHVNMLREYTERYQSVAS